jgi:hypothetical protein
MFAGWRGFLSFCALRPGERAALSPKNERADRRGRRGAGVLWAGAPGCGKRDADQRIRMGRARWRRRRMAMPMGRARHRLT